MKICIVLMSVLIAITMCLVGAAQALTDKTVSVTATASISGTTSLSKDTSAFTYGTTTADAFPTSPNRVVLTYSSNYNPWKIDVYTNNTQIPNKADPSGNGMYAKGGLVAGSGPYSIVPLKWVSKNPASPAPNASTIDWQSAPGKVTPNFVKDKKDEDDPATPADIANESWDTPVVVGGKTYPGAFSSGYANIAWGPVPGHSGVCVDPLGTDFKGDTIDGTVAVYVAGLFATGGVTPAVPASAGEYSGTINFDLYHP